MRWQASCTASLNSMTGTSRPPADVCTANHCSRIAAGAAAVAAAAVVVALVAVAVAFPLLGKWKTTCNVLLSFLPVAPCSHFLPFSPCDPFCLARFPRRSRGFSPDSSMASRRPQVWAVVHTDPPGVSPPCHVSIRHIVFLCALNSIPSSFQRISFCVVISSSPSCPSWASASLSSSRSS